MKVFNRIFVLTISIFFAFINILPISADDYLEKDNQPLTQEQVDAAFTDKNFQEKIKLCLKGITNTTLPHSTQTDIPDSNIFIGKKSFQAARIDNNNNISYREYERTYLVFGGNNVFGVLILRNYKGTINCQYIKTDDLLTKAMKDSEKLATFVFPDSEKYWKLYGVNEKNKVYSIMTEEDDINNLPAADYNTIKSPDDKNVIDQQCFIPAYTLDGKPIKTLNVGAGVSDKAIQIHK